MSGVTLTINPRALRVLEGVVMDALVDLAEYGGEESDRIAPIEEGTLIRSRTVSRDDRAGKVAISYDTPYAVVQHEDTQLRHDEGRQAKFLEDAMLTKVAPAAGEFIAQRLRRAT